MRHRVTAVYYCADNPAIVFSHNGNSEPERTLSRRWEVTMAQRRSNEEFKCIKPPLQLLDFIARKMRGACTEPAITAASVCVCPFLSPEGGRGGDVSANYHRPCTVSSLPLICLIRSSPRPVAHEEGQSKASKGDRRIIKKFQKYWKWLGDSEVSCSTVFPRGRALLFKLPGVVLTTSQYVINRGQDSSQQSAKDLRGGNIKTDGPKLDPCAHRSRMLRPALAGDLEVINLLNSVLVGINFAKNPSLVEERFSALKHLKCCSQRLHCQYKSCKRAAKYTATRAARALPSPLTARRVKARRTNRQIDAGFISWSQQFAISSRARAGAGAGRGPVSVLRL
ncbi:hypothetical protein J6590_034064 [Homalodisca vitripennis]|nr:hypothetical protein J6590_034064 [Homalodisca vitripennis]